MFTRIKMFVAGSLALLAAGPALAGTMVLISSNGNDQVLKYSESGAYLGVFASKSAVDPTGHVLNDPTGIAQGSDGTVYVGYFDDPGNGSTGGVARFNMDGTYLGAWTNVRNVDGVAFGSDGYLYVGQISAADYVRINPTTGAIDSSFNTTGSLPSPNSYVRGVAAKDNGGGSLTLAYDAVYTATVTGSTVGAGTYHAPLGGIQGLAFGPDGNLYSGGEPFITKTDLTTNVATKFIDDPTHLTWALGLGFDSSGNLYVNDNAGNRVVKYDGTGAYVTTFAPTIDLNGPHMGVALISIPEPGTLALLGTSLIGLLAHAWRKRS